jgi:hypothetical protein
VQGELLRAVEKLRDEAQRNANQNWNSEHVLLADFVRETLLRSLADDPTATEEVRRDLARLLDPDFPVTCDELYRRLTCRVIDWCHAHPQPVELRRSR